MSDTLLTLLGGHVIGSVERDPRGQLRLRYDDDWRSAREAFPLSLSMPLVVADHRHEPIEAFLWGLLPDNELVLDRWARRFQVSARNAFALIAHVGEDCAGAVQFVRPERLEPLLTPRAPEVDWLDEAGVGERLRMLREDHAAWRSPRDAGQFSLAGAQPKTALLYQGGRWGVPSGRTPTTHILKPPSPDFDGHAENEHLCLSLARALGLPAVTSEVRTFDGETAIAIERYDRAYTADLAATAAADTAAQLSQLARTQPILRLHQEDMCQALALLPTAKYQNEGGPTPERIVSLLRTHSSRPLEDVNTFLDALAFNWLIAGTDAHAKNYSLLHGRGGRVRLAPLYDIASALAYKELDPQRLKLAMKVGDKYRIREIGAREWQKLASELRLSPNATICRIEALATDLPKQLARLCEEAADQGLRHAIVRRLRNALTTRAQRCIASLRSPGE
jgi:serine/threonine-protein kinase HipA